MGSFLAVSIGNTRVGLGVFDLSAGGALPRPGTAGSFPLPQSKPFSPPFQPGQPVGAAVVASVNPPCEGPVLEWIEREFGAKPLCFPRDVPAPIENRYDPADALGADRLANAIAASEELEETCLVVDAGTAMTVDAVSADGPEILGGAILPGIALSAAALSRGTALLPVFEITDMGPAIGTSTRTAMSSGVLRGLAGAIDRLVADIWKELGADTPVLATGGDASRFAALCTTDMQVRPHLTLVGLAVAYLRHARGAPAA